MFPYKLLFKVPNYIYFIGFILLNIVYGFLVFTKKSTSISDIIFYLILFNNLSLLFKNSSVNKSKEFRYLLINSVLLFSGLFLFVIHHNSYKFYLLSSFIISTFIYYKYFIKKEFKNIDAYFKLIYFSLIQLFFFLRLYFLIEYRDLILPLFLLGFIILLKLFLKHRKSKKWLFS